MREELRLACPGEAVLDGTALFVFRPAAYRYGTLIRGVREWVARGVVAEEVIADDMRAARAPVAHVDFRIRGMIGPLADVLRRHYVEGPDKLLVAGAHLVAPDGGGRSFVDLLVPGPYLLYFTPELEVAIDGAPARRGLLTMTARTARGDMARTGRRDPPRRRQLPGAVDARWPRRLTSLRRGARRPAAASAR